MGGEQRLLGEGGAKKGEFSGWYRKFLEICSFSVDKPFNFFDGVAKFVVPIAT